MQPWGKVASISGANTLFEGQQINGHTQRGERHTDKETEETEREREREIKDADQGRSKEEPGPLRDTTSEGHNTL
jgi:hypothetical protein